MEVSRAHAKTTGKVRSATNTKASSTLVKPTPAKIQALGVRPHKPALA